MSVSSTSRAKPADSGRNVLQSVLTKILNDGSLAPLLRAALPPADQISRASTSTGTSDYVRLGSLRVARDGYPEFQQAQKYLSRDPEARSMLHDLEHAKHPIIVNVQKGPFISGEDGFDPDARTIDWNASTGFKLGKNQAASPALVLLHEEAHATGYDASPKRTQHLENTAAPGFPNAEEQRVVTGPESRAATMLGEGHRTTYATGQPFQARSVDSTK